MPGQHVYVTGNTAELGNWDTDLAIPLKPRNYPTWINRVNLKASTLVTYKYFRNNSDGTVTWESLPGAGNRSLSTPAGGGILTLNDSIAW